MRALKVFLAALLVFGCVAFLFACGEEEKFGLFDNDGEVLVENAHEPITAEEAKKLISENAEASGQRVNGSLKSEVPGGMPLPTDVLVTDFTTKYSSCTVTTTYYGEDGESTQSKFFQSAELKEMLQKNEFSPFSQLLIKYAVIFPDVITYMEAQNEAFRQSPEYDLAPVQELFSYYTNRDGNLVIQIKSFENLELSGGTAGGVNSVYRQDIEIVYDENNKISFWQGSMGITVAMPDGEVKQGCVMKAEFAWEEKSK